MPYTLLQGGRQRRRRRAAGALALLVAALALAVAIGLRGTGGGGAGRLRAGATLQPDPAPVLRKPPTAPLPGGGTAPAPFAVRLEAGRDPVRLRLKHGPSAGLLFDLDSGRVLWRRAPTRVLPVASLTKMITALVVVDHVPRDGRVLITREAMHYQGSGVGLLPRGRRIPVRTMLYGLLLPSGNDAAIALAQRAAGTVPRFVRLMNLKAQELGLTCSRFTSPSGFYDRGNHSCAADLAAIARAVLHQPRLRDIVRRRSAVLPFPIKGRRIYLYNNNWLMEQGYRGVTGVKTGYTRAAGLCLVATARRGRRHLGVVLLHTPDPAGQASRLLDLGFRAGR
jgi:serine-type D-Ala-D-Ala carboxypeptidase (penicillin-binding protein 5/6)